MPIPTISKQESKFQVIYSTKAKRPEVNKWLNQICKINGFEEKKELEEIQDS